MSTSEGLRKRKDGAKAAAVAPKEAPEQEAAGGLLDVKLVFLVVGLWATFTMFGMAQEALTRTVFDDGACKDVAEAEAAACKKKYMFNFTWFLVLLQSVGNTFVAVVGLLAKNGGAVSFSGGAPVSEWLIVSFSYLGAHKFGMMSLFYIIFPLQVLVKSCKAVPVMFGEAIFQKSVKVTKQKMISVFMLVAGVVIFTLAKGSKKGKGPEKFVLDEKTMIGLVLVLAALFCDGIYGPYQGKIKEAAKARGQTLNEFHPMFNMNFYQGVFALLFCVVGVPPSADFANCELLKALEFIKAHPAVVPEMVKFSAAMAAGNLFVFRLQLDYSSLTVTKTTTVRKLISVFVSVYTQGHQLKPIQWVGAAVVFGSEPISKKIASLMGEVPEKRKPH